MPREEGVAVGVQPRARRFVVPLDAIAPRGVGIVIGFNLIARAAAGGGVVEVKINGKREVTEVLLKEEIVDPDDIEMLQDLIVAAMNEALKAVENAQAESMAKYTGAMGGLGGMGGFGF